MPRLVILQHLEREGPGLFAKIAKERGMTLSLYRLDQGVSLPQLVNDDLLLVLGGPMGVRDINNLNFPWLSEELHFIKDALKNEIRIIGICLGAQLLAYAAGGDIEILLDDSSSLPLPEVGWGTVFFTDKWKNLLGSLFVEDPFKVLHWHGDRIVLPPSAELIASSNCCNEQFFKIGAGAFGLQFHVEIDNSMVEKWINEDTKFIRFALGLNAEFILREQQKLYGKNTIERRLFFLRRLFDLIGF